MPEQNAMWYDGVYRAFEYDVAWHENSKRRALPAMRYAIGSVLDIGCGSGQCGDMTGDRYHGLDFSPVAIEYARANVTNSLATFEIANFMSWYGGWAGLERQYDTVLLLEVLEHVDDPQRLADMAKACAGKRIIVTAPIDMPYVSHVKHSWTFDDIEELFGELSVKAIIGNKWLMAVYDIAPVDVSVCMIVRNEAECLERALNSTIGLADEIIVVDTGSTDDTLAIARDFGCSVYTGADRMHKAQSRNLALAKATGKWHVILDADEIIQEPVELRKYLPTAEAKALYTRVTYMEGDMATMSFSQIRAWQRGTMRYKYRCHELPLPTNGSPKLAQMTPFVWEHRAPPRRDEWKLQYSLDRLLLDVTEHPKDPRPVYYLGRQYLYMKQYNDAITWLKRYVIMGGHTDIADCWYSMARCYKAMGEHKREHIAALHQACAVAPHRREFWGSLANEYFHRENHTVAISLMKLAIGVPMAEADQVQHGWHGDKPQQVLEKWIEHADRVHNGAGLQPATEQG